VKRCLSCDCPVEEPGLLVDGLCEGCFRRIERLRSPLSPVDVRPRHKREQEPAGNAELASRTVGPVRFRLGISSASFAILLVISGFGIAGGLLSFDSRLGGAVFGGGSLCAVGSFVLLLTMLRDAVEPLQKQNEEIIGLLKQIADQRASLARPEEQGGRLETESLHDPASLESIH
jgi:hypothetical protein